ncbi:GtrA family protein [Tuwongella immobilis]|uniref:GtrA/DPMS transmembrane domain-containing protein n=1 Tax=Tuwongella immobilis TaxID=692036 RepID=A0A6C2YSE3_9BACT|nr:GtrA family protein [Tuwongella immobilis]VIP03792.1 membrane protein with -like domain : Putative membrane protein OS=Clostridium sp. Maddingley MBC34-26 GN=A370_05531 PE=4 SV=1: GtrA [Tuwongella immobilis]VTS04951.1 membrane protein with -like domain : Putative membrane protein OS=Clostridium sp. Maddingley MBC34-26 GN=A370_05531 PE=4 SV=1: GtrA [Tuwongella immobilis]
MSETRKQLLRFVVIGCTAVLIDLGMYTLLTGAGLGTSLAKGLAYLTGMIFGFIGNKFWTFESSSRSMREPMLYLTLYTCSLGVNVAVNSLVLAFLGAEWKLFAFLTATGVSTVMNFVGLKWVTFRNRGSEPISESALDEPLPVMMQGD